MAVIVMLPSPFQKIEAEAKPTKPTQTISKPVQAVPPEIAVVVPPVSETPVVEPPAPVQEAPTYTGSHEDWMSAVGIDPSEYSAVDYIISRESGWCATKSEGEYGECQPYHGHSDYNGYGLCQSTPPGKMANAGADWETNPMTQLRWCTDYAIDRYGGWWPAYEHWISFHNW